MTGRRISFPPDGRLLRDVRAKVRSLAASFGADVSVCDNLALVVDADLRPEGKQGPLVRTLGSHAAYYDQWSHVWEA